MDRPGIFEFANSLVNDYSSSESSVSLSSSSSSSYEAEAYARIHNLIDRFYRSGRNLWPLLHKHSIGPLPPGKRSNYAWNCDEE